MKITRAWLEKHYACTEGKERFLAEGITEPITGIKNLIAKDKLDWANWLLVRVMTRKQYLAYAIFAAEQVIGIFEKNYPDDKRPRQAIEAAKAVLAKDTKANRNAAYAASGAASAAASGAAYAACAAAYAACDAAYAASDAAYDAASAAAYDAASAAYDAASAAYAAASAAASDAANAAARKEMKLRILNYGLGLLERRKKK